MIWYVTHCCNRWGRFIALDVCGLTIKFANSPPCACRGSTGQKPSYCLITLTCQCFTAALLLIYGSLFLSGICYCLHVFWCATARMSEPELEERMNIKFLVKLGKSGNEVREMLVQVYGEENSSLQVGETFFWGKRKCHWWEIRTANNEQNWRKNCKSLSNCAWKSSADCQEHSRASEHRQRNRKILTEDLDMRKVCAKMVQRSSPKNKSKEEPQFAKIFWRGKMTFWAMSSQVMKHGSTNTTLKGSCKVHNGRLPIPYDQKSSVSPNQESKQNFWLFFDIRGIVHYEFVPTGQIVNQVY